MSEELKINKISGTGIILMIISIPTVLISYIFNFRIVSFIFETIAVTVYSLMFIYYLGIGIKNKTRIKKIVLMIIRIILLLLFLYFLSPGLLRRYMDFPSAITKNYLYEEGTAKHRTYGSKGLVKFDLNGKKFSISSYNYDHILKDNYYKDINIKVWYLPKSKYIVNMK